MYSLRVTLIYFINMLLLFYLLLIFFLIFYKAVKATAIQKKKRLVYPIEKRKHQNKR